MVLLNKEKKWNRYVIERKSEEKMNNGYDWSINVIQNNSTLKFFKINDKTFEICFT